VSKLLATPPLAIAAGIAGATQLAIAAATPIPQYMHGIFGDESHPGGKMIVGDGGERELMVAPSGALEWSPSTATLMTRPKGTQVIPEHILMDSILNGQSALNGGSLASKNDYLVKQLINSNRNIVDAIKSQPGYKISIDKHGYNMSHQKGNAHTTYINSKINL
jgi:hypothetical protein